MKKKRFLIFAVVGAIALSVGIVATFPRPSDTSEVPVTIAWEKAPWAENTIVSQSGVTITVDETPVIAEPDVEGQEYIVQEDGTITIYLK